MAIDISHLDGLQLRSVSAPPEDFDGLSIEDTAEVIKEWFLENFEDPADSLPYESAEGGYQWIWGGPYDAREVVESVYADVLPNNVIEAAVNEIQGDGTYDWTPHSNRVLPPEDESPKEFYAAMRKYIAELEATLDAEEPVAGIGHNEPPEAIGFEPQPLTQEEKKAVRDSLAVLKSQPVEPPEEPQDAIAAIGVLQKIGDKAKEYLDTFLHEAAKSAGAETGKAIVKLAYWTTVLTLLSATAAAALQWLQSLL